MINVEKKEYVLCAAIHFDNGKKYLHQPKNIDSGIVFCGHRHHNIFQQTMLSVAGRQEIGITNEDQGFLTNKNRFVSRKEGGEIAFASGQTSELIGRLHSEDLY